VHLPMAANEHYPRLGICEVVCSNGLPSI
jgi:hypothetical protein